MEKCIAVIGMHRSGTSLVTKALESLGINLGQNLIPGSDDNPKGFWEDKSIIDLNDRILALAGMSWYSVNEYPFSILNSQQGKALEEEALGLVSSRLDAYPFWGFKDPRSARLLPFWQKVFTKMDVAASYLVVLRNPLDIATSLKKRNDFNLIMCQHLWLIHTFQNLKLLKGKEVCFVSFDDFLNEPAKQFQRFSHCFNLPIDKAKVDSFVQEFVNPDLRHSYSSLKDLTSHPGVFPFVQKLYAILNKLADDSISFAVVLERWDELEREYFATTNATLLDFCFHAQTRNADVERLINLLEKNAVTLAKQHRFIERQTDKNDRLKKDLDLICNSITWQMTKPLRDMITLLKKKTRSPLCL